MITTLNNRVAVKFKVIVECIECIYWQTFSVKGLVANILGLVGHVVSIMTTKFCSCGAKTAADNM